MDVESPIQVVCSHCGLLDWTKRSPTEEQCDDCYNNVPFMERLGYRRAAIRAVGKWLFPKEVSDERTPA